MKLQPPKGTKDLLPEENEERQEIYKEMRDLFETYGYGEVKTPAFEHFELLAEKSGPQIEEEIYAFEDKGGRKLGLRFDPTVPIARIVASDPSKPKPIKYYYITRMWRYDQPQAGRMREFWQAGCELIGTDEPEADAEILKIANDLLESVTGERFTMKVNSRDISEAIAEEAGATDEEEKIELFRAIDKLDKKSRREVRDELMEKGVGVEKFDHMMDQIESGSVPKDADENLEKIIDKAKELGVSEEDIEVDLSIARGLDYYTGFVFETFLKGKEDKGSVCSGGRYDSLIGLYGNRDVPATGFGLGIDRLLEITEKKKKEKRYRPADIYVCPVNDEVRDEALRLTQELRADGFRVDTDLKRRGISKQLKYIDSKDIPYALIIGPREIENEEVSFKDMETGEEKAIGMKEMQDYLKELPAIQQRSMKREDPGGV